MLNVTLPEPLLPIRDLLPTRSPRWIADHARIGKIPHAVKLGREWCITASAFAAWTAAPTAPARPTVEDATADLRRRGLIAA